MKYTEDFLFNATLLKKFWEERDRKILCATSSEIGFQKQKFLVLYNSIAKVQGCSYTMENMKSFENGPLYYDIYKHVRDNKNDFIEQIPNKHDYTNTTTSFSKGINEYCFNLAKFLVTALHLNEVIDLVHNFDFWRDNYSEVLVENCIDRSEIGDKNDISEDDFTASDSNLIKRVINLYDEKYLNSVTIKKYKHNIVAIKNSQIEYESRHFETLNELNFEFNPVDVILTEEGVEID